jgi:hypothetical protein
VSKTRTIIVIAVCGFFPLFWNAALDRDWPDWRLQHWLVYVGGLVVIALVALVVDSIVAARRERSDETSDAAR